MIPSPTISSKYLIHPEITLPELRVRLSERQDVYGFWAERPIPSEFISQLGNAAYVVGSGSIKSAEFEASASQINAIIASASARYDAELMQRVRGLKVIARTGIGVDNISLADATRLGVAICNTPEVPTIATAEHAIALMFAITKHLPTVDSLLKTGQRTDIFTNHRAIELAGSTLGVVGMGRIGSRVALIGQGIGMSVIGYDPFVKQETFNAMGVLRAKELNDLLRISDVVTLHMPSTPETYHIINEERLKLTKKGAYIINTARGPLIDEKALFHALETGHLHGAGLDVFDPEPPETTNPLLHRPDVIATPHVGGITVTSRINFWTAVITQSLQVLNSIRPTNLVNPEVWDSISSRS